MAARARGRRSPVVIQPFDDAMDLAHLWDDIATAASGEGGHPGLDRVRARWTGAWDEAEFRVVAFFDGESVGLLAMSLQDTGPWVDRGRRHGRTATITLLHVRVDSRRHGAGTALLGEALRHAERSGAEHLAVDVPPASGRTNRFYARLGFAPVTTRRVAGIGALRRRLAGDDPVPRRRLLRRRDSLPPADAEPDSA